MIAKKNLCGHLKEILCEGSGGGKIGLLNSIIWRLSGQLEGKKNDLWRESL